MTGTTWEHQRDVHQALQMIMSGPRPGTTVSRTSDEGPDREVPARALRRPPAGSAPALPDDPIL